MNTPLIEIKNLSAGYDSRTVLRNVNLTVYDRDFLGIIGPNGRTPEHAKRAQGGPAKRGREGSRAASAGSAAAGTARDPSTPRCALRSG